MPTVNVVLDSRQKKDKTFAIKIRITDGNQSRYIAIGYSIKKEQFKEGLTGWVIKHPDALYINSLIEDKRSEIVAKVTRLELDKKPFSFECLLSNTPITGHTIGDILKIIADRHFESEAITLAYRHVSFNNQLKECFSRDMPLSEIGVQEVRQVEHYFRVVKGNLGNTVSRKFRFLRAAFKEAQLTWGINAVNPFDLIKIKKGGKPGRMKLSKEQIDMLEKLPLMGGMDIARDVFLFCYYSQGMRFGDAITLMVDNLKNGEIHYVMGKSEKPMIVSIHNKLKRLIDKYRNNNSPYLLPVLKAKCLTKTQIHFAKDEANSIINSCLERIGNMIGIEKLRTHIARHSYAQLLKNAKIDPWTAKESLGHSKISTTEGYMADLGNEEISKSVTGLY